MLHLKTIIITTITFLLLDAIWIGYLGKQLYLDALGSFMHDDQGTIQVNYIAAMLTYVALVIGIVVFVIPKAAGSVLAGLGWGALFGLVCYGIYDFTNLAIINKWPIWISVVDIIWGGVVCSISTATAVWFSSSNV